MSSQSGCEPALSCPRENKTTARRDREIQRLDASIGKRKGCEKSARYSTKSWPGISRRDKPWWWPTWRVKLKSLTFFSAICFERYLLHVVHSSTSSRNRLSVYLSISLQRVPKRPVVGGRRDAVRVLIATRRRQSVLTRGDVARGSVILGGKPRVLVRTSRDRRERE